MTRRKWFSRTIITINFLICLSVLILPIATPSSDRVAVFLLPWSSPQKLMNVIVNADGLMVNGGQLDWVVVAQSTEPNFTSKLYNAGAWLVVDAELAISCLPRSLIRLETT